MWELVEQNLSIGSKTERLKVPGGWIVKHTNKNVGAECMTFISDSKYVWNPKETK